MTYKKLYSIFYILIFQTLKIPEKYEKKVKIDYKIVIIYNKKLLCLNKCMKGMLQNDSFG